MDIKLCLSLSMLAKYKTRPLRSSSSPTPPPCTPSTLPSSLSACSQNTLLLHRQPAPSSPPTTTFPFTLLSRPAPATPSSSGRSFISTSQITSNLRRLADASSPSSPSPPAGPAPPMQNPPMTSRMCCTSSHSTTSHIPLDEQKNL